MEHMSLARQATCSHLHHGCWKSGCPGAGAGAPRTPSTQHWHTIAHDVAAGRLTRRPPTHHVAIGLQHGSHRSACFLVMSRA